MSKEIVIEQEEWFSALADDIKSILTEGIFNYRWTLIKTYHLLGRRILEDKDKFGQRDMVEILSHVIGRSEITIKRAIQFAEKYPDLDKLPEGKNTSWHKIVNKYLPNNKESHICDFQKCEIWRCKCGKVNNNP